MYARTVTVQIQPNQNEAAVAIFQNSVIPAAREQKGFISLMLLTNPATGKGLSISLWESEADLQASEANSYFQAQLAKFGGVFAGPPAREAYEVSTHS